MLNSLCSLFLYRCFSGLAFYALAREFQAVKQQFCKIFSYRWVTACLVMLPIFQNAYVQMQVFGRRSLIPFVACLSSFLQLPKFLTFFSIASRGVTRGCKGAHFRERRITAGVPKSPNNAKSTFFNTVHLLPKDLRIEYGDAKLVSFPGRHLTSLRPDCIIFGVKTFDEIRQSGCLTMSRVLKASIKRPCFCLSLAYLC